MSDYDWVFWLNVANIALSVVVVLAVMVVAYGLAWELVIRHKKSRDPICDLPHISGFGHRANCQAHRDVLARQYVATAGAALDRISGHKSGASWWVKGSRINVNLAVSRPAHGNRPNTTGQKNVTARFLVQLESSGGRRW
jgi:hypothetical protein